RFLKTACFLWRQSRVETLRWRPKTVLNIKSATGLRLVSDRIVECRRLHRRARGIPHHSGSVRRHRIRKGTGRLWGALAHLNQAPADCARIGTALDRRDSMLNGSLAVE